MAWKEYCEEYWLTELPESIDRCTGRSDINEILLKMVLNIIQSIQAMDKGIMPIICTWTRDKGIMPTICAHAKDIWSTHVLWIKV